MPLTQTFRDDDVERTAERFRLGEAEDAGRAAVPKADHTLGVGVDDRIGHAGNETVGKMLQRAAADFSMIVRRRHRDSLQEKGCANLFNIFR